MKKIRHLSSRHVLKGHQSTFTDVLVGVEVTIVGWSVVQHVLLSGDLVEAFIAQTQNIVLEFLKFCFNRWLLGLQGRILGLQFLQLNLQPILHLSDLVLLPLFELNTSHVAQFQLNINFGHLRFKIRYCFKCQLQRFEATTNSCSRREISSTVCWFVWSEISLVITRDRACISITAEKRYCREVEFSVSSSIDNKLTHTPLESWRFPPRIGREPSTAPAGESELNRMGEGWGRRLGVPWRD